MRRVIRHLKTGEDGVALSSAVIVCLVLVSGVIIGLLLFNAMSGDEKVQSGPLEQEQAAAREARLEEELRELNAAKEKQAAKTDVPAATAKSRDEYEGIASGGGGGSGGNALSGDAEASFSSLEAEAGASVGLAIAPFGGSVQTLGSTEGRHAWSSIKVPILATLMRQRQLSSSDQANAEAALTASDNNAAAALFSAIEGTNSALESTLNETASEPTVVATAPPPSGAASTYGQTLWSPAASAEFYRALACGQVLDSGSTSYVLGLMGNVISEQQWGLASASFPGASYVGYKAGWGPEGSASGPYLVRQSGIVEDGNGNGFAVTMVAQASSGSFEGGVAALNTVAGWLSQHLGKGAYGAC
ncbi:MAG TPA: serine hydrolase [Solirubrobacterales bacterium]|nr:serine hydrolase [Solirubrobacterales bacterium]